MVACESVSAGTLASADGQPQDERLQEYRTAPQSMSYTFNSEVGPGRGRVCFFLAVHAHILLFFTPSC